MLTSQKTALPAAASIFAGYTALMLTFERDMRRAGGPGIIAFELAGTEERANRILASWGDRGRRAARASLWLDFGYAASYAGPMVLLVDRARLRHSESRLIALLPVAAAVADAVEGCSLLAVLRNTNTAVNARRGRRAALTKFSFLAVAWAYLGWAWLRPNSVATPR